MLALARPIIGALLEHGEFSEQAAVNTGRALAGFSIGLVGFSVYLFVLRGFYAHQDTRTPFVINVVENLLNIVFAVLLVGRYGVLGLGLAFALAYLLERGVGAPGPVVQGRPATRLRPIFASLGPDAAGVGAHGRDRLVRQLGPSAPTAGSAPRCGSLAGTVVGIAVYLGVLALLRSPELAAARRLVGRSIPS